MLPLQGAGGTPKNNYYTTMKKILTLATIAILALAAHREHIVYMLWGGYARSKAYMIDKLKNLVLESVHPSPLSANRGGWFGQHQFSRCNAYLKQNGQTPIVW